MDDTRGSLLILIRNGEEVQREIAKSLIKEAFDKAGFTNVTVTDGRKKVDVNESETILDFVKRARPDLFEERVKIVALKPNLDKKEHIKNDEYIEWMNKRIKEIL